MTMAKIVDGVVVYPPIVDGDMVNCNLDEGYLQSNGYTDLNPEQLATAIAAENEMLALNEHVFTKLQIRRAMRALGEESVLDALITSNEYFGKDWSDAQDIDLDDELTASAIVAGGITDQTMDAIKLKIAELSRALSS